MYVVEGIIGSNPPEPVAGGGPFETLDTARAFAEEVVKQPGIVVGIDAVRILRDSEEIERWFAGP